MVAAYQDLWLVFSGVAFAAFVLGLGAVTFVLPHLRLGKPPASKGHRPGGDGAEQQASGGETVAPDGYIDSFANIIEEAGGGLPVLVWVALIGIGLWWLLYLILFWNG